MNIVQFLTTTSFTASVIGCCGEVSIVTGIGNLFYPVSALQLYGKQQSICRCNQQHQSGLEQQLLNINSTFDNIINIAQVQEVHWKRFLSVCLQPAWYMVMSGKTIMYIQAKHYRQLVQSLLPKKCWL